MTEKVKFALGERKYVCIQVRSSCMQPFEICSAKYVLRLGNEIEKSGECEIQKKSDSEVLLSALIQPQVKGAVYALEYTYEIAPEILKYEVKVCGS